MRNVHRQLLPIASNFKILIVSALFVCASGVARAQQPVEESNASAPTRSCSANPVLAPGGKKKSAPKAKHAPAPELLPACLEVKGEPLEIQETLQGVVRDSQWRVHDNHATEDTWTFVRYVNSEELEKYAETKVLIEPVDFTDGKAAVLVRTVDIGGGYVRVQISAHFEGEGKSTDATLKQPATSWPLNSKGILEKELLASLQSHYQHLE